MSIIRTRPKGKRWRKNWSGRGLALMNAIEEKAGQVRLQKEPSLKQKLTKLLNHDPRNRFYNSLLKQMKFRPLSRLQMESIIRNYSRLVLKN